MPNLTHDDYDFKDIIIKLIQRLMIITPIKFSASDKRPQYITSDVYTTYHGKRVWVSAGYRAQTAAEAITQAFGNAMVKLQRLALANSMKMNGLRLNMSPRPKFDDRV